MMTLRKAAKAINAELIGNDQTFTHVGTDTRTIRRGQLFIALKGERFDGHEYVKQALDAGAAGVVVQRGVVATHTLSGALVVDDTYQALGQLAAYWRTQHTMPLIGVTGSNGKTTVKEMLLAIFKASKQGHVLATAGNLNNHIGMPLTLLRMSANDAYAVVEMGMNHSGEIRYLTQIAKPDVVLINNAGNAHLGELGSYEAIAKAKGEILEGLSATGIAVLNADDDFYPLWKTLLEKTEASQVITFGVQTDADVTASYQLADAGSQLQIKTPAGELTVNLHAPGKHNVMNALAASAAALAVKVDLNAIKNGLENFVAAKGRLQYQAAIKGAVVIDDTYNANPTSMKAAVDVLKAYEGKQVLVLGDMGELGEDAKAMHVEIGEYAKAAGIDTLLTIGYLAENMAQAFGENAMHFPAIEALIDYLNRMLDDTTTVLVKGSRFMAMERVVEAIANNNKEEVH